MATGNEPLYTPIIDDTRSRSGYPPPPTSAGANSRELHDLGEFLPYIADIPSNVRYRRLVILDERRVLKIGEHAGL